MSYEVIREQKTRLKRKRLIIVLGISLLLSIFTFGCGVPKSTNPNPPTPAASSEDASKQANSSLTTPEGATITSPKPLPAESMISASQLDKGIKAKKTWQIIDVREVSEFATGHVPQAVNIPLGTLDTQISKIGKDKDVILVCLNGTRAYAAWQALVSKGYDPNRLKVLVGGMEQWKSLGSGEITESIGGC